MNLFNLVAKLTLDDKDYKNGLKDAKDGAKDLGNETNKQNKMSAKSWLAVGSAVAVVVAALAKATKATIDYGGDVDDNAQKMNMSTDAYQKWSYAMKLAGGDVSSLQTGMKTFTGILDNASKGQADALITLEKLGLGYEDLIDLEPEEAFKLVVEQLQGMEAGAAKTQLAVDLFGKAGQELLPILNQEAGSLDELFTKFEDLGLIMDEEGIAKSAELGDKLDFVMFRVEALGRNLAEKLYPAVEWLFEALENGMDTISGSGLVDTLGELFDVIGEISKVLGFENGDLLDLEGIITALKFIVALAKQLLEIIVDISEGDWSGAFDSLTSAFKTFVNFFIDVINDNIIGGINRIKIPNWSIFGDMAGKGLDIPTIPRLQRGAAFIPSDMYPAYLDYGERVLTRTENEEYTAFGGVKGIEALVNGISMAIRNSNSARNQQPIVVQVQIGEKSIKDITYKAVNDGMKSKGLKSLNKVGAY